MNYEEKRELRLQISQMLADAGINQAYLKEIVLETLNNKVNKAINECIASLNAESNSGNFIREFIDKRMNNFWTDRSIKTAVLEAIQNKVIKVVLDEDTNK